MLELPYFGHMTISAIFWVTWVASFADIIKIAASLLNQHLKTQKNMY